MVRISIQLIYFGRIANCKTSTLLLKQNPPDCESLVQRHRYQRQYFHWGYSYLSVRSRESCSTSQVSEAVFSRRLQLFIRQIRYTTARGCSVVSLVRSRGSCSFPVFSLKLQLFVRHIARLLFNVTSIRGQCPGSLFVEVSYLSRWNAVWPWWAKAPSRNQHSPPSSPLYPLHSTFQSKPGSKLQFNLDRGRPLVVWKPLSSSVKLVQNSWPCETGKESSITAMSIASRRRSNTLFIGYRRQQKKKKKNLIRSKSSTV